MLSAISWLHISSWQHNSKESNVDDACLVCFLGELSHCIWWPLANKKKKILVWWHEGTVEAFDQMFEEDWTWNTVYEYKFELKMGTVVQMVSVSSR